MVDKQEGQWVVPNPQVPRTFGMLNIVFGGLLILMGAGYLVFFIISPTITKQMMAQVEKAQAVEKAEREAKLAELKRQEDAAKTKEEKETFKTEREDLEKRVEPVVPDLGDMTGFSMYSDPRLAIFYFTEVIAGIVLNILMVISGIGLLGLSDWGRRLAIGVSWGKIVRWVAMAIVTLVLVLPITTQKMQKMFDKIEQQTKAQSGGRPVPPIGSTMAQFSLIGGAVVIVVEVILFSIYPGLSIWFLTRARARAACMARPQKDPLFPGDRPGEFT
jgi:hypothetical protein